METKIVIDILIPVLTSFGVIAVMAGKVLARLKTLEDKQKETSDYGQRLAAIEAKLDIILSNFKKIN